MEHEAIKRAIEAEKTPFYLFDTDAAAAKVQKLKSALGPRAKICFAVKANPFLAGALEGAADFFEVCSPGEARICARAKVPDEKIVLSGVYKDPAEIRNLVRERNIGCWTVESLLQWELLCGCAKEYGRPLRLLLRLSSGSQFGLEKEDICRIFQSLRPDETAKICGIQYFSGTQKKSAARIEKELAQLDDFLRELHERFGFDADRLEYGPGFPVDYFGESPGLEDETLACLQKSLRAMAWQGPVVLEMGREPAAFCGCYVTSVVDVKQTDGENFCIADGGIHQLTYYGQMLGLKTPPVSLWDGGGERALWSVFGSLCTKNDVLVKNHPFDGLRVGSRLVFEQVGAYAVTEGIALFLSRELPPVLLWSKEKGLEIARGRVETDRWNSPEGEKEL